MRARSPNNIHEKRLMKIFPVQVDLLLKSDVFQKRNNWQITSAQAKKLGCCNYWVAVSVVQVTTATLYYAWERKQERLSVPCLLGQTRLHDTGVLFSSKVHKKVVKSPLTASRNKNTLEKYPLPQFLSSATKHIGSLYIMYWHQEFQLFHTQPILVLRKHWWREKPLLS